MLDQNIKLNPNIFRKDVEKKTNRLGYGEGVVEAGKKNKEIVVLTADLAESTKSHLFEQKYPERFIDVGVAEQNLAGISAGLALSGKIPFMASYGVFSPGRNWEQIRISICYSNANVKIIGSHGGLTVGPDGASHQALEDIALLRVLPNMIVLSPVDYYEAKKATIAAADIQNPVYIRLAREDTPILTTQDTPFAIGKAQIWAHGRDITLIAHGPILYEALLAAKKIKDKISCEIINCPTIKPLDKETILTSVKRTNKVIVVEEHQIAGGLGSTVAEFLSEEFPVQIKKLGIQDVFGESGSYDDLKEKHKLNAKHIAKVLLDVK